jgi:hypothetical protein
MELGGLKYQKYKGRDLGIKEAVNVFVLSCG